jgi:hypothetical protein
VLSGRPILYPLLYWPRNRRPVAGSEEEEEEEGEEEEEVVVVVVVVVTAVVVEEESVGPLPSLCSLPFPHDSRSAHY